MYIVKYPRTSELYFMQRERETCYDARLINAVTICQIVDNTFSIKQEQPCRRTPWKWRTVLLIHNKCLFPKLRSTATRCHEDMVPLSLFFLFRFLSVVGDFASFQVFSFPSNDSNSCITYLDANIFTSAYFSIYMKNKKNYSLAIGCTLYSKRRFVLQL